MTSGKRLPLLARDEQHRGAKRYPISLGVEIIGDGAHYAGRTVDISSHGALLELRADHRCEVNTVVDFAVHIPAVAEPLVFPVRIARVTGGQIALQFEDPPQVVRDYVSTALQRAYPSSVQASRLRTMPPSKHAHHSNAGKLSIVVPMFNEEAVVQRFHDALDAALVELGVAYEIIYVDDGSSDDTLKILTRLSHESSNVRAISLSRNFGHQAAVFAGLQASEGVAVVTMDGDLQHPPSLIRELVEHWKRGIDVVHTVRRSSGKQTRFKQATSRMFYALFASLSTVHLPPGTADFRLLDRYVVDTIVSLPERSPFLRGLARWIGFKDAFVEYDAPARAGGESKYTLSKMIALAMDGLLSFSAAPLRLSFVLAALAVAFTTVFVAFIAWQWINHTVADVPGWSSLLLAVSLSAGAQLFVLGIIAEYVGRILAETKARPRFLVGVAIGDADPVFEALVELCAAPRPAGVRRADTA